MMPIATDPTQLELESVACDLCGAGPEQQRFVTQTTDHAHDVKGLLNVVRCETCGLHFLNPRPTQRTIGLCYPHDYYAYTANAAQVHSPSFKSQVRKFIRANRLLSGIFRHIPAAKQAALDPALAEDLPDWRKPGAVLDVGCGAGAFLDGMRDNGWRTYGIEPSENASQAARAKGHQVVCQSATDAPPREWGRDCFDIILMSHSLEHVHSPLQALQHVRSLLDESSGRLVVEVPNLESLLTYFYGELGLVFDTPRHLYMFSPDTLNKLLNKAGFEVLSLRHISRPMHFIRCFRLLAGSHDATDWAVKASAILQDPAMQEKIVALSNYASEHQMGGEIRIVAACR